VISLFIYISYNIKAKSQVWVCVSLSVCVCVCICPCRWSKLFGVTSLFIYISYNIKAKSCVCVCLCRCLWRNWYSQRTCWHNEFQWLGQLFCDWRQWFRFWEILSQYLTLTYTVSICLRKELQGQKMASTYTRIYMVIMNLNKLVESQWWHLIVQVQIGNYKTSSFKLLEMSITL